MLQGLSFSRWGLVLGMALATAAGVGACGTSGDRTSSLFTTSSASSMATGPGTGGQGGSGFGGSFTGTTGTGGQVLDVEPSALQTITVTAGQTMPTVAYKATVDGSPTKVTWSVDRGDAATIGMGPSTATTFSPTGTSGGLVNVLASQNGKTLTRQVFIQLQSGPQSGPTAGEQGQVVAATAAGIASLTQGGGVGGVGGEGLGPAFTGFPTTSNPAAAMGLAFVYPYAFTVWPRGMLAPLLMWTWAPGDADAIQISLATTSGSFSWTGTFGRPAVIGAPGSPVSTFTRHPIPQDVWDMATNTAGGPTPNGMPDELTLSLTVAKGGMAYGPITETWIVAPAHLAGTVYYNSYGTRLVQNSTDLDHNHQQYGAAVLSITSGATGPTVAAGVQSGLDGSGCRVCHVVSADGSRLIAVHGDDYKTTSSYDLKNADAETVLTGYDGFFDWAGLYPDSSVAFTNRAYMGDNQQPPGSLLYALPPTSTTPLAATGIPGDLEAGTPAFSPDGKHVAFDFISGTIGAVTGDGSQLVALDFDLATLTFSNIQLLATVPAGKGAGFPSFFPTNDAVAFHYQVAPSQPGSHYFDTWHQAEAQVWWSDLKTGTATVLGTLNGLSAGGMTSYLPTGPNNHGNDTVLNYEPTVNPVVSGGYAWVVFTSRRLYGNLATNDPWLSDPRNYDDTQYANTTCKKLWVAAVDIGTIKNGMFVEGDVPGSDPSHPAFYLPAQELTAGNSRGFWVLDPCKPDGPTSSCMTGDQCCNGFCEPNGPGGALICGPPMSNPCSGIQDKCTQSSDCCDPTAICVNGFCALGGGPT